MQLHHKNKGGWKWRESTSFAAIKSNQPGHDPVHKCRFICDIIAADVNAIAKKVCLDLCGDESAWPHAGFGEAKTGLVLVIGDKPGVNKGRQIVVVMDCHQMHLRAFLCRHKKHNFKWSCPGASEAQLIWEHQLEPLVTASGKLGAIFSQAPHMTWDNHFSGDCIVRHAATEGFGLTTTCRHDRLPMSVPSEHFCKEN